MIIVLYDGTRIECEMIEISMNKEKLIYNECDTIPLEDIMRIVPKKKGDRK